MRIYGGKRKMIYVTGDCHGDFSRFSIENFPDQKEMKKGRLYNYLWGFWKYLEQRV